MSHPSLNHSPERTPQFYYPYFGIAEWADGKQERFNFVCHVQASNEEIEKNAHEALLDNYHNATLVEYGPVEP